MKKVMEPAGGVLFQEKQPFPRWVFYLMLGALGLTLTGMLVGYFIPGGDRDEIILALAIVIPVFGLIFCLLSFVRYEKVVTREGFYYRWMPLQKSYRKLGREDIRDWEFRNPPFMQYGFGFYPGYGWYHVMSREQGWQVYLSTGRKVFFGTADPFQFERALREFLGQNREGSIQQH